MKAKITLEDDREFEDGEVIEARNSCDVPFSIYTLIKTYSPKIDTLNFSNLLSGDYEVRKLTPKVKKQVPRTIREVADIVISGVELFIIENSQIFINLPIRVFANTGTIQLLVGTIWIDVKTFNFRTSQDSAWQPLATKEVEE